MIDKNRPGYEARQAKGLLRANRWLIARRVTQFLILALFLAGPIAGIWIVKGNLTSSLTLSVLPLSDPFVLVQSLLAGHMAAVTSLIGAAIVVAFYVLVGGRVYCSFVCPMNVVTDTAAWLARRFDIPKGWRPARETRLWALAAVMVTAVVSGTMAWELINPVTLLHRALVYGLGWTATVALAVFVFDLVVSRNGWCGHLCPMGAFYSQVGRVSLVRVSAKRRDQCNDCLDCFAVCPEPHVITPALRGATTGQGPIIFSGDCTNCGRCIDVCSKDVFAFDLRFNNVPSINAGADKNVSSTKRAA